MTQKQKDHLKKALQDAELSDAELDDVAGGAMSCESCETCHSCEVCESGVTGLERQ